VAVIEVREADPDTIDRSAAAHLDQVADRARVLDSLATLSVDERVAIVLRFEADMTIPQIAGLTGARAGTIKSRLHNARRKLRMDLEPGGDR